MMCPLKNFVIILLFSLPVLSQTQKQWQFENTKTGPLDDFDEIVEDIRAYWSIPGIAMSIVRGGEVIYAKGFGKKNDEENGNVTPDTLFPLASCTKAFTALTVAQVIDESKIDWTTPVQQYYPDFHLYDEVASARATALDLMSHRTGMPRHDLQWYHHNKTRKEILHSIRYLPPSADFRSIWQYSNQMFMFAGQIVEEVTGITWEEHLQTRVFDKLNMTRTGTNVANMVQQEDYSRGYECEVNEYFMCQDEPKLIPYYSLDSVAGPAGAAHSSVNDMSKWLLYLLSRGKLVDLVSPSGFEKLLTPQMVISMNQRPSWLLSQSSYALGWVVTAYKGKPFIWHNGGIDGFSTFTGFFPDDDLGISILTNSANIAGQSLAFLAADRVLGLHTGNKSFLETIHQYNQYNALLDITPHFKLNSPEITPIKGTKPTHPLAEYTGLYKNLGYGTIKVTIRNGKLHFKRLDDLDFLDFDVEHFQYDIFAKRFQAILGNPLMKMAFQMDMEGRIKSVLIDMFSGALVPSEFIKV